MPRNYVITGISRRDKETYEDTEPGFIFDLCLHFPDETLRSGDVVAYLKTLTSVAEAMGGEFIWNDDAAEFDTPKLKWTRR